MKSEEFANMSVRFDLNEIEASNSMIPIPRGYEVEACIAPIITQACALIETYEVSKGLKKLAKALQS